jgi:hypothetical protein
VAHADAPAKDQRSIRHDKESLMQSNATRSLITAALLAVTPLGHATDHKASPQQDTTTAKDVREEVADAAEAIKDYSADKRKEAAEAARAALETLDARIAAMQADLDRNWDRMDAAAREKSRATMDAVAEWYGALKNSSAEAWDHVKKGFTDAYRSLRNAWQDAERERAADGRN